MLGSSLDKDVRLKLLLWEDKDNPLVVLTNLQKDSVFDMSSQLCTNKIYPETLPVDDLAIPAYVDTSKLEANSQNFSFLTKFAKLEKELVKSKFGELLQYATILSEWIAECNKFLEEADSNLEMLTILKTDFIKVATKTNLLHEACEILLDEQSKCVQAVELINDQLVVFKECETVHQKINSPTFNVQSEHFSSTLYRIDECIDYLKAHEHFKESTAYLEKFQNYLVCCLRLLKNYVFNTFETVTHQVMKLDVEDNISENAFVLLYGKFRMKASKVKGYIEMIENRKGDRAEYLVLLNEVLNFYISVRSSLLIPSVSAAIKDMSEKHSKDLCYFIRSGCILLVHICEDEHNLFNDFFSCDTDLLNEMLESLCMLLYDALRPLIIHVIHMESLTEICSIFQDELVDNPGHTQNKFKSFKKICSQMLQDVQERLVYRTNIYIKNEILNYVPSSGDLAYPEKLDMIKAITEQNSKVVEDKDKFSSNQFVYADHALWYPTVKRSLTVLSKLHRSVDKSIFHGLSQEVLACCVHSLIFAKKSISTNKSNLDGELFFIKHLLILREQIIPFQLDNVVKETSIDFSKIKGAAVDLIKSRSNLFAFNNNNALLQFFFEGTPSFYETFFDCKKVVDDNLKKSCEDFIKIATSMLVGNLQEFMNKISIIKNKLSSGGLSLKTQPFASPENVKSIVTSAYRILKQDRLHILKLMSLYLSNSDTEYILFKPIKSNILQVYNEFGTFLKEYYTEEDMFLIAAPSIDQINILMNNKVEP
ncbi:hypothetical protein HELRODRAFT_88759 [Helobdella robusta]|uniref:Conserved oligomeric Golgi complex subunit 3 n=1 Tax=Helobdella robusta TaxID=6412 RepID=T1G761_HELRO|nr:hypothetical protein HELRODRAFT_88759 [Helobdella robusta]ESN93408.1 hypothetical protein HELRODRAFT_88759 [Helobdella robusta]